MKKYLIAMMISLSAFLSANPWDAMPRREVLIDNQAVRVTRHVIHAYEETVVSPDRLPQVIFVLEGGVLSRHWANGQDKVYFETGETYWQEKSDVGFSYVNYGYSPVALYVTEIKGGWDHQLRILAIDYANRIITTNTGRKFKVGIFEPSILHWMPNERIEISLVDSFFNTLEIYNLDRGEKVNAKPLDD